MDRKEFPIFTAKNSETALMRGQFRENYTKLVAGAPQKGYIPERLVERVSWFICLIYHWIHAALKLQVQQLRKG
jgi:hypothetical protein